MGLTKLEVARRQLGAALALFLDDRDPVAVHVLACGGAEIAEQLAILAGAEPFRRHALATIPDLTEKEFVTLRNKNWNAFKHLTAKGGAVRDDKAILDRFNDRQNDSILFIGWRDYSHAAGRLPIEAQAFELWFHALNMSIVAEDADRQTIEAQFPGLAMLRRPAQKERLRRKIAVVRHDRDVMSDPLTERRPLMCLNDF